MECSKCIMRTEDDPLISFNNDGVCNHCQLYEQVSKQRIKSYANQQALSSLVNQIKKSGGKYDCIIGLSGGVDSSYVAYLVKKLELNPLAVHLDNGWNSELAVKNIENIVSKLGIDLYTYVIDWEEFKDLQLAYLKASVVDIEALTDHAIVSVLYQQASKYGVKYILNGSNVTTEGVLPSSWVHYKNDLINIRDIQKKFGTKKIKTFPTLGLLKAFYYKKIKGIKAISILNYITYNKFKAKETIIKELEWRDYGGKHYESIFTRFYQAYILPEKFNIDKRRSHLSTLVCSGQLTKQEASEEIKKPICDENTLKEDIAYVIKKFGLKEEEFELIMNEKPIPHTQYKSILHYYNFLYKPYHFIKYKLLNHTAS